MTSRSTMLRVAAAQPVTITGDVAMNVIAHAEAVRRCAAGVVVFPELSVTGYTMDAPVVDPLDPVLDPLIRACADARSVALVGAAVEHGRARAIGVIAVDAGGARVVYRKMSLGGPEVDAYRPGAAPAVIEVDGWRIGLGICKDTRITDHLYATAAVGMDIYAAGMVHAPDELDEFEVRAARIIDLYGVAVVFAGFAGSTGGGYPYTSGGSAIWDEHGNRITQAGGAPDEFVVAELTSSG